MHFQRLGYSSQICGRSLQLSIKSYRVPVLKCEGVFEDAIEKPGSITLKLEELAESTEIQVKISPNWNMTIEQGGRIWEKIHVIDEAAFLKFFPSLATVLTAEHPHGDHFETQVARLCRMMIELRVAYYLSKIDPHDLRIIDCIQLHVDTDNVAGLEEALWLRVETKALPDSDLARIWQEVCDQEVEFETSESTGGIDE